MFFGCLKVQCKTVTAFAIYSVPLFCVINCFLLLTSVDAARPQTPPALSCHLFPFGQTLPRTQRSHCTVRPPTA